MTTELLPIKLHNTARLTDLTENNMRGSAQRMQNQPVLDMPGRAAQDTLVSPMTAMGRYNAYKNIVQSDQNVLTMMEPQPYTQPTIVQLFAANTFGSSGNYLSAPLYASDSSAQDGVVEWNSVMTAPTQRMSHEYSLDGRVTHSFLRKTYDMDTYSKDFVYRPGFDAKRPTTDDFEQSMNIKVNPGQEGSYEKDQACECKIDLSRGTATVQVVCVSSANYERLYRMMRDADLLGPIEKLVVFRGRSIPCLCSWITPAYANTFVGFTQNMIKPVIHEPDIVVMLNGVNQAFIDRVLANYQSTLERRKLIQYKRFMGPAAGFVLPPMDGALAPGMGGEETKEMVGDLTATRYEKIDGASLFGSVDTYAAGYQLAKPRISGYTEDMYLLTGIDARPQLALVEGGAVTTGLEQTWDYGKAMRILQDFCGKEDEKLYTMGIPLQ